MCLLYGMLELDNKVPIRETMTRWLELQRSASQYSVQGRRQCMNPVDIGSDRQDWFLPCNVVCHGRLEDL